MVHKSQKCGKFPEILRSIRVKNGQKCTKSAKTTLFSTLIHLLQYSHIFLDRVSFHCKVLLRMLMMLDDTWGCLMTLHMMLDDTWWCLMTLHMMLDDAWYDTWYNDDDELDTSDLCLVLFYSYEGGRAIQFVKVFEQLIDRLLVSLLWD